MGDLEASIEPGELEKPTNRSPGSTHDDMASRLGNPPGEADQCSKASAVRERNPPEVNDERTQGLLARPGCGAHGAGPFEVEVTPQLPHEVTIPPADVDVHRVSIAI